MRVFGLAGFGGGGGELQLALFEPEADGAGALVGELGYARDGRAEFVALDEDRLGDVFGQHGFVVGELAGELARGQQARADAEEERGFVFGEVDGLDVGVEQGLEFVHRFLRDQRLHLAGDAFELFSGALDVGEAMAVGGHHGDRLGLEDH